MRVDVFDGDYFGGATCALRIYDITGQAAPTIPGSVSSGDAAQPGFVTLENDALGAPVVNNALFSYVGRCHLGAPTDVKLFTFTVDYTVTGLAIP